MPRATSNIYTHARVCVRVCQSKLSVTDFPPCPLIAQRKKSKEKKRVEKTPQPETGVTANVKIIIMIKKRSYNKKEKERTVKDGYVLRTKW